MDLTLCQRNVFSILVLGKEKDLLALDQDYYVVPNWRF